MKVNLGHFEINVNNFPKSVLFYKKLLGYLKCKVFYEDKLIIGVSLNNIDIWIKKTEDAYKKNGFHRKITGLNHLGFEVKTKEEVEKFYKEFLLPRRISTLYESPKAFPEYTDNYFAVYFEDPDRIKLEVFCK